MNTQKTGSIRNQAILFILKGENISVVFIGLGSIILGTLADHIGLSTTIILLGFLPLHGFITFLLPSDKKIAEMNAEN